MNEMSENKSGLGFDFMPETDGTFIAPNEKFNSFTQSFSNTFGLKASDDPNSKPEDCSQTTQSLAENTSKPKTGIFVKKSDKFIDFVVNQYKSDGFLCTLDENQRQIYYCYYCHQYVNDFDLIQTHIDTSKHLNSVLNGISFDRGLDKEFVIESISDKIPKNIHKLIYKELSRIPLHLKHYYFRNDVRLMDVMPPNAYFCSSCSESIPNFKSIDSHILSEKHILSQQKPSLMEMIEKTDDPVLKIGLQFITEEKIEDSSQVVYECELCNCFDCNYHKMFSHIKSRDHRINLLKRYDYETTDLTDEELENLIKNIHEMHGSGLIKTSQSKSKMKTSVVSTPVSVPSGGPNTPIILSPEPESAPNVNLVVVSVLEKNKTNAFLREDKFLPNFEDNKIIETYESDGREIYYCCYCDEYYNSFSTLEKHIEERTHTSYRIIMNNNNGSKGLNQKFSMKRLTGPSLESNESPNTKCLENIPILTKHFYFKRGIKYLFDDIFYCRFCQIRIESFDDIKSHFESESHIRIEEIPTKFNDLLFQTNQPIIGLKYIKELINDKSKHIVYECILCDYSQNFCQMFVHLSSFNHQYRVLKRLSPKNQVFKYVKEKEVSFTSSELLKTEISTIEEEEGCGFLTKCITSSSPTEPQKSSEGQNPQNLNIISGSIPKTKVCESTAQPLATPSPLIISEVTDKRCTSSKPFVVNSNDANISEPVRLTEGELLSSLQTLFSVHLQSEDEASTLVAIVESLKDSLIKYYNVIPVIPKHLLPFIKSEKVTSDQTDQNDQVCQMDQT